MKLSIPVKTSGDQNGQLLLTALTFRQLFYLPVRYCFDVLKINKNGCAKSNMGHLNKIFRYKILKVLGHVRPNRTRRETWLFAFPIRDTITSMWQMLE